MSDQIKIVLVDDEELFRKGISFLLEREKNMDIIFEASDGSELIDFLRTTTSLPDIIITDLKMPVINGVEATKIIHKEFPEIKIIALTSYDTKSFIANMIQVGAVSYLVKNTTPKEVIDTINEVATNGFFYNQNVINVIEEGLLESGQKLRSNVDKDFLTSREKEVLHLICKQLSTVQIGEKLFLSPRTVEGHRNSLLLKTESKNAAGLVVFAIQNKIFKLDDLSL